MMSFFLKTVPSVLFVQSDLELKLSGSFLLLCTEELSLFKEARQRFWVQKAAGVQTLTCGLIPEDVPLCGPFHKFQPLVPFCIWIYK